MSKVMSFTLDQIISAKKDGKPFLWLLEKLNDPEECIRYAREIIPRKEFTIFIVSFLSKKSYTQRVSTHTKVSKLKKEFQSQRDCHLSIEFLYMTKRLEDDAILGMYPQMGDCSTVFLLFPRVPCELCNKTEECIVCFEELKGCLFRRMSCGHRNVCPVCLEKLDRCPSCREKFRE